MMNKKRVVLGYSGGVDSTAAVSMLKERGLDVVALTLDMCGDNQLVEKAREAATSSGVQFATLNCEKLFQQEIKDYFASEYIKGRTPAPCTRCNPRIKWRLLMEYADANDIYYIATGHYFRVEQHNGKFYVCRAADKRKDQSYYLWGLNQEVLKRVVTPMAEVIKEQINTAKRKESMGVCFLRGAKYSDYIANVCGEISSGEIVDVTGAVVGVHDGLAYYTVGQKRGEGIPTSSVVVGLNSENNQLVVGADKDLYHTQLIIKDCNIVDKDELLRSKDISVMIRGIGRNPDGYALDISEHDGGYRVVLSSPAWACAAGQPVVLYRGERVIGGGYLEYSLP